MAEIRIDPEGRRRLDRLIQASDSKRLRPKLLRRLDQEGRGIVGQLRGQAPWAAARARGDVRHRVFSGQVAGQLPLLEISSLAELAALGRRTFPIPISPQAREARTPERHPQELLRIIYRGNTRIIGGLYNLADTAISRSLVQRPTQYLLARRFELAPELLRHRVERQVPRLVVRLDRWLVRALDPSR